jgi:hypothetical protein
MRIVFLLMQGSLISARLRDKIGLNREMAYELRCAMTILGDCVTNWEIEDG